MELMQAVDIVQHLDTSQLSDIQILALEKVCEGAIRYQIEQDKDY